MHELESSGLHLDQLATWTPTPEEETLQVDTQVSGAVKRARFPRKVVEVVGTMFFPYPGWLSTSHWPEAPHAESGSLSEIEMIE